jgi:predicted aconitase
VNLGGENSGVSVVIAVDGDADGSSSDDGLPIVDVTGKASRFQRAVTPHGAAGTATPLLAVTSITGGAAPSAAFDVEETRRIIAEQDEEYRQSLKVDQGKVLLLYTCMYCCQLAFFEGGRKYICRSQC